MVEDSRTSADDASCRGTGRAQSWLFCAGGRWPVAVAAERLGTAPCAGGSYAEFRRSAMRAVADSRQLRAALHVGVLSPADRVGQFFLLRKYDDSPNNTLVPIDRCLAVYVDLIRLLIHLLVVLDVVVDRGSIVLRRHVEALFQLNSAYRVDPEGHVRAVFLNGRIFGNQVHLGSLHTVDRLISQV